MAALRTLKTGVDTFLVISINGWNFNIRNLSKYNIIHEFLGCPKGPKRPPTPYFKFFMETNSDKSLFKQMKASEIHKLMALKWKNLEEGEKEKYFTEYQNDMLVYQNLLDNYKKSLTAAQKLKITKVKSDLEKFKSQSFSNTEDTLIKSYNKPKKPISAYLLFIKENTSENIHNEKINIKMKMSQWKYLSDNEKEKFIHKAEKEREEYKKNLESWELKMLKEGNFGVISSSTLKELKNWLKKI